MSALARSQLEDAAHRAVQSRSGSIASIALFCLIAGILCARPLVSETFQRLEFSALSAVAATSGPTPATTAVLDSVLLICAAIAFLAFGGARRPGPFLTAAVLLLAAICLSVTAAALPRPALNAGSNLLATLLAGGALARLAAPRWVVRLLLAAILATAGVTAIECIRQRAYEFDDTLEFWEQQKTRLAAQGVQLDDPVWVNYERRLHSREAFGYLSHPNLTASCLLMASLAAAGILAGALAARTRTRSAHSAHAVLLAATLTGLLAIGILLTGSAGALLALSGALVLMLILGRFSTAIAAYPGRWLAAFALGYALVVAAAVGYGLARGALPGDSLKFRWHYWTAAAATYREAPWTGIGRENFQAAYLRHKPAESPEDVSDPHNLWVSLLVELGPLGLLFGLTAVGALLLRGLRGLAPPSGEAAQATTGAPSAAVVGIAATVLLTQLIASDLNTGAPGAAIVWAADVGLPWIAALLLLLWLLRRMDSQPINAIWVIAGLLAAIAGELVHSLIDFALLTPSGTATLAVLAAVLLRGIGGRESEVGIARLPAMRYASQFATGLGVLALTAVHIGLVSVPTCRVDRAMGDMSNILASARSADDIKRAVQRGQSAVSADPLDCEAARITARILAETPAPVAGREAELARLAEAERLALLSLARGPRQAATYRALAEISAARAATLERASRESEASASRSAAADAWRAVALLDPTNPRVLIGYGEALRVLWRRHPEASTAEAARSAFRKALELDDRRPPGEVMRLRDSERRAATEAIQELSGDK